MTLAWGGFLFGATLGCALYFIHRAIQAVPDATAVLYAKLEAEVKYLRGLVGEYETALTNADKKVRELSSSRDYPNLVPGMPKHKYPRVTKLVEVLSQGRAMPMQFLSDDGERLLRLAGLDPETCGINYQDGAEIAALLQAIELELVAREGK